MFSLIYHCDWCKIEFEMCSTPLQLTGNVLCVSRGIIFWRFACAMRLVRHRCEACCRICSFRRKLLWCCGVVCCVAYRGVCRCGMSRDCLVTAVTSQRAGPLRVDSLLTRNVKLYSSHCLHTGSQTPSGIIWRSFARPHWTSRLRLDGC